jgi:hypothetical protein
MSLHFTLLKSQTSCVGSILSTVGPEHFFNRLDLKITGVPAEDSDIPLKWLLPIVETKLSRNVSISVFFRKFASMADNMIKNALNLE